MKEPGSAFMRGRQDLLEGGPMFPRKQRRGSDSRLTCCFLIEGRVGMEDAKGAHKLLKVNDIVALGVKYVKDLQPSTPIVQGELMQTSSIQAFLTSTAKPPHSTCITD